MSDIYRRQLICRTCLKIQKNLVNVFEHFGNEDKSISEILTECTPIQIRNGDGLPMNICNNCMGQLHIVYKFKSMVTKSNERLHRFYGCININEKSEDIKYDLLNDNNDVEKIESTLGDEEKFDNNDQDNGYIKEEEGDVEDNIENINIGDNDLSLDSVSDDEKNLSKKAEDIDQIAVSKTVKYETYDDNDADSPIKSLDIGEYEKLKATLSRSEKAKARLFCKICKRSYKFNYYFSIHLRMHIGQLPHKCKVCGRSFAQPSLLRMHMPIHNEDTPHTCEVCGKSFKTPVSLYAHKSIHNDKYSHECTTCGRGFKIKSSLKVHMKRHSNEKLCVCEICGKSFGDNPSLVHHRATHNTELNYECNVCGKLFKTKRCELAHRRLHDDVRPHVCSYCNKTFKVSKTLKSHILVHTGDKPYSCKFCGKPFRTLSALSRHIRTHSGETPFCCKLCPAKFKYSHHLKNHNIKVHEKEK